MNFLRVTLGGAVVAGALIACGSSNNSRGSSSAGSGGSTAAATTSSGKGGGGSCEAAQDCPDGAKCNSNGTCKSSNCVDGVCCNTVCNATCVACSAAKNGAKDGVCGPVTKGTDPDAECAKTDVKTCGANGMGCNGDALSPGCARYDDGTACIPGTCMGDVALVAATCKAGACGGQTQQKCAPFTCEAAASACFAACKSDAECSTGAGCLVPKCYPQCELLNADDKFTPGATGKLMFAMRLASPLKVGYTVSGAALFLGKVSGKTTLGVWSDLNGKPDKKLVEASFAEDVVVGWQGATFPKPVTIPANTAYYVVWTAIGGEQPPLAAQGSMVTLPMSTSMDGGLTWGAPGSTPVKLKVYCN